MMEKVTDDYVVHDDGTIRFTEQGLNELRPYLGKAGIDIREIRTYDDYLDARRRASPYFMSWLSERAHRGAMTFERRALIAALESDDEEFAKMLHRLKAKKTLRIVTHRPLVEPEAPG